MNTDHALYILGSLVAVVLMTIVVVGILTGRK